VILDQKTLLCFAYSIGIRLSFSQINGMERFAAALLERTQLVNLTAITDPMAVTVRHFCDSLTLLPAIPHGARTLMDVGTGAGFPGVVVALCRPDLQVTLVDAQLKKIEFVREICTALALPAICIHGRAELLAREPTYRARYDVVTQRAVAELRAGLEYAMPLTRVGGVVLAMKGPGAAEERVGADAARRLLGGEVRKTLDFMLPDGSARSIVCVKKVADTPPGYPRSAAAIKKRPL